MQKACQGVFSIEIRIGIGIEDEDARALRFLPSCVPDSSIAARAHDDLASCQPRWPTHSAGMRTGERLSLTNADTKKEE
jgi:hypothetical protein